MGIRSRGVIVAMGACVLAACASSVDGSANNGSGGLASSSGSSGTTSSSGNGGRGSQMNPGTSGNPGGSSGTSGGFDNPTKNPATRPPPSITSVAPLAGDYGTVVTVTGDNLDEASAELVLGGPVESVTLKMPAAGTGAGNPTDVIVKWSKTEIQFKYPFPAEGAIGITTASGQAPGGSFEPSWRPGSPMGGAFTRREVLAIVSPSAGTTVAAFDGATGPHIVVATPDGAVTSKAFDRGATALLNMSLVATPDGGVEGFWISGGTLVHMTDVAGAPSATSTGVAAIAAAASVDGTGVYVWVRKSNTTLVRVRPPSWTEEGTAVADPTPANALGPSISASPDGALFVGWGVTDGGSFPFYDEMAYPVLRRLRLGQTTFDAQQYAGGGADDVMVWTRFRSGPAGRVLSYYCANDTGIFENPSLDCGEGYLDSAGTLGAPVSSTQGQRITGWNASAAAIASCDPETGRLSVGPEGDTASATTVLFPCTTQNLGVIGVGVDPANAATLLVQSGNYLYNPRKR